MVNSPQPNDLPSQVQRLKAQLAAVTSKAPNSLIVTDDETGIDYLRIAPVTFYVDPDGRQITTMDINDYLGDPMFSMFPATVDGNVGTNWYWAWTDRSSNQVFTSDGLTGIGLGRPFSHVPLYPTFTPTNFAAGVPQSYAQIPNANMASEVPLWQGRLDFIAHPAIYVNGIWGQASGSGGTYTFHLKLLGTTVGSWTVPTGTVENSSHVFDVRTWVADSGVDVTITGIQSGAGAGTAAAVQLLGLSLGETPAAYG